MKKLVGSDIGSYVFTPASRTIAISGVSGLSLNQFLLITNVTSNKIVYNFADSTLGGTLSGNILTLAYDTTAMSADDSLQIYIDQPYATDDEITLLRRIVKLLESSATVDSSNRQKIIVDNIAAVAPTVNVAGPNGTLTSNNPSANLYSGSSVTPVGIFETPVDQRWRIIDAAHATYAACIRSQLVNS
jgi:hypothetical protein